MITSSKTAILTKLTLKDTLKYFRVGENMIHWFISVGGLYLWIALQEAAKIFDAIF